LNAFIATRALPASVFGPVERRQGCARRVRSAWRARRSAVQPLALRAERPLLGSRFVSAKCFMTKDNPRLQHFARRKFFL
jgi:hypothetical protein